MDIIKENNVDFIHPFLPIYDKKRMAERLCEVFEFYGVPKAAIKIAVEEAYNEYDNFKADIRAKALEIINYSKENNKKIIVLAGRPYHLDPEINHGIPELISSYDFAVLTEDSVSHLGNLDTPIRVVNQWMYHSRLYRAADYVRTQPNMELIQLNSFGCGLDAVTTDQVEEILKSYKMIITAFLRLQIFIL